MRRLIRIALWVALVLITALVVVVRVRYGGGEPYPDLTGIPILDDRSLDVAVTYPEPIGNVAVSSTGRLFFTVHPESRPSVPGQTIPTILYSRSSPRVEGTLATRPSS